MGEPANSRQKGSSWSAGANPESSCGQTIALTTAPKCHKAHCTIMKGKLVSSYEKYILVSNKFRAWFWSCVEFHFFSCVFHGFHPCFLGSSHFSCLSVNWLWEIIPITCVLTNNRLTFNPDGIPASHRVLLQQAADSIWPWPAETF